MAKNRRECPVVWYSKEAFGWVVILPIFLLLVLLSFLKGRFFSIWPSKHAETPKEVLIAQKVQVG